ncbi:hypothetical protein HDU80_010264 [Chytriomyces hyalinus]|nr:hypothetical protein HDU80_010264 [Chytriomyces hyalinus]
MTPSQSISLTRAIHTLLIHSSAKMRDEILLKPDVHNAEYYRNKYSQELRSELDMLRHNEMALLRTDIEGISRIVEGVAQKTSEKISNLKAEISMDVNKHKAEGKEVETITDLRIQGIHHKLTVELSALKARIEALKMEATQRAIWVALITFASVLVSSILVE